MLKAYVEKCRELYNIAFLQWRNRFPSSVRYKFEEIDELLTARLKNLKDSFNPNMKVLDETRKNFLFNEKKFKKTYKLADTRQKTFLINSFKQVGWEDPFPEEDSDDEYDKTVEGVEKNGDG